MSHDAELITVERAPSTALAERWVSLLAVAGIDAFMEPYSTDESVSGEIYTEFCGVEVKVRRSNADQARALLGEAHAAGRILKELWEKKEKHEREHHAHGSA